MRLLLVAALAACRFEPGHLPEATSDALTSDGPPRDVQAPGDAQTDAAPPLPMVFVLEAEDPDFTVSADGVHNWTAESSLAGFTGTGYASALPTNTAPCGTTDLFCGALSTYNFTVAVAGTYRVTLRHFSPGSCCDSVYWFIGFGVLVTEDFEPDTATGWTADGTTSTVTLPVGATTFNMRIREPGARVDSITIELQ